MAVTFTVERAELEDTANNTIFTVPTFTPAAGSLLVAVLWGTDTAATFNVVSLNGTGLTWTDTGTNAIRNNGTVFLNGEIWWATTTGAATGTVSVTWSEGLTSCVAWIGEFAGANLTTPIPQIAKNEAGTTDPNVSLGVAPSTGSLSVASYMGFADLNQVAEGGWTSQLAVDTLNLPTIGFGLWVSTGTDQTFTAAGTDGNHVSMIAEIQQAAVAATSLIYDPNPTSLNTALLVQ